MNGIENRHMQPEEVDQYSLGDFSAAEAAPFDEHLLICDQCRAKVEANDVFVGAMRLAAGRIRGKPSRVRTRKRSQSKAGAAGGRCV